MALFAMADLHLSNRNPEKTMEVFGSRWTGYISRIEKNWRALVTDDDTVVIPGDISWALTLTEALDDLKFIDRLPGRKLLGKGNHDFWWGTLGKMNAYLAENGISTISFLYNNAFLCDGFAVAGTRGWFQDEDSPNMPDNADYEKVIRRESLRLETSLACAEELKKGSDHETAVFLHFPPVWNGEECREITSSLKKYGVRRVWFGHIHGNYICPRSFEYDGINYSLISADFLNFIPQIIHPE